MTKRIIRLTLAAVAAFLPAVAFATSSGLNNIPTADTPGHREGVLQWFSTFPTEGKADHRPTSFTLKLNLIFNY